MHDRLNEATFDYCKWFKSKKHDGLETLGLIPCIGEIFDGINALFYLSEDDYVSVGLSAGSMMPVAGYAFSGTRVILKTIPFTSKSVTRAAKLPILMVIFKCIMESNGFLILGRKISGPEVITEATNLVIKFLDGINYE